MKTTFITKALFSAVTLILFTGCDNNHDTITKAGQADKTVGISAP